jgi:hypothetical protein
MPHILEHVPPARGYSERGEVSKVYAVLGSASKNVHGVVDKRCGMALSRNWYVADTVQLGPRIRSRFISPHIVEPSNPVCATE